MARITVEDCLMQEGNRFALVQLASKRTKELLTGKKASIPDTRGNKPVVVSLREIAAGKVRWMTAEEAQAAREAEERAMLEAEAAKQDEAPKEEGITLDNVFETRVETPVKSDEDSAADDDDDDDEEDEGGLEEDGGKPTDAETPKKDPEGDA